MSALPILIVGAGPTGLILALCLVNNGVPVRIIEKQQHQPIGWRGSGIQARSLDIHHFLGTIADVKEKARDLPIMRIYALPGGTEVLKDLPRTVNEKTPGRPYANALLCHQAVHEFVVRSHLEREGVVVELATTLENFEQHQDHVLAHITKPDGQTEEANVSFLVGTDGGRGVVRKLAGFSFDGKPVDEASIILGDIRVEEGPGPEFWHMWGSPQTTMTTLVHTKVENIYSMAFIDAHLADENIPITRDRIVRRFYEVTGRTDIKFGDAVYLNKYRPSVRMVTEFNKGRVILAGDAAHIHSASGGQGMNSSIQDSFNLAWKLSLVHKGAAPFKLLDSYTTERIPVIASMLQRTSVLHNATMRFKDHSGFARGGLMLSQLGVNYRTSPIILDERHPLQEVKETDPYDSFADELLCAGDRAPDAPGLQVLSTSSAADGAVSTSSETRLFNIFGPMWHTVLLFAMEPAAAGANVEAVVDTLKTYDSKLRTRSVLILPASARVPSDGAKIDIVVQDSSKHAWTEYQVDETAGFDKLTVVVVRPDGVVGAVVLSCVEGIKIYFEGILS